MIVPVIIFVLFVSGGYFIYRVSAVNDQEHIANRLDEIVGKYALAPAKPLSSKGLAAMAPWVFIGMLRRDLRLIGADLKPIYIVGAASLVVVGTSLGFWYLGLGGAAASCATLLFICRRFIGRIAAIHLAAFQANYPNFVDRIHKLVTIGNSLSVAFEKALEFSDTRVARYVHPAIVRQRMGVPLATALDHQGNRLGLGELSLLAFVVQVNMRFGGNLGDCMKHIAQLERNRLRSMREFEALTSETAASARLLIALPIIVAAIIFLLNPSYIRFFLDDPAGMGFIGYCVASVLAGSTIMKRVSRIDP